jgi:ketosteroid isomerase-like protein
MIDPSDHLAIRALTAQYNDAFDSGDVDGWVATFTDDGVFESRVVGRLAGHHALRRWFVTWPHNTIHATTDARINGNGDRATQSCTVLVFERNGDQAHLRSVGNYTDRLEKTPSGWRFAYRNPVTYPIVLPPAHLA